jgi:hypothetical protein
MAQQSTKTNITNLGKPTFDKLNKSITSSDYLKNKKSRIAYCNSQTCGKLSRTISYDEKILFNNGKYLSKADNNEFNPDHKYDLSYSLYSALDLSGTFIVTDISNNEPTCIDISLIPFYESYNIDTDNSLFGDSGCNTLNYVQYMTNNLDYIPPTTVKYNRS